MQQRFTQINIDRFFRLLDRLEPIYNENKVHQLINSPEATARLKGKTFNPLKITIMTSLLIILVTAIILWTGNDSRQLEMQNTAEQVQIVENAATNTNLKSSIQNEAENLSNEVNVKTTNTEVESTHLEVQPTNGDIKDPEMSDIVSATLVLKEDSTNTNKKSKPLTPPATIKGDLMMVVADQELLEKLGFQFIDESVFYKNKWGKTELEQANYTYRVSENGKILYRLNNANEYQENDAAVWTNNDFYPVAESYRSGEMKSHFLPSENLEMANDTLFPIYCPQGLVNWEPNDIIFWFTITDDFIQQLPKDKKLYAHKIQQYTAIKDQYSAINLIDYTQEPLIDSTKFIELTVAELFDFGFSVQLDSTHFSNKDGFVKTSLLSYMMIKDTSTFGIKYTKSGSMSFYTEYVEQFRKNPNLIFITNINGDFEYKIEDKDLTDTRNLIPLLIRKEQFSNAVDKDRVYWFSLSDKLFNALPERISTDLQKEYNYIVAENKSDLVKPDCVYFDECKNTLLLSNFKVFPNPANQQTTVTFTLPKAINGRISLVDLAGRERQVLLPETSLSKGFQRFGFDLSGVSEGMYLITLYSDQGIQVQRLMVSH